LEWGGYFASLGCIPQYEPTIPGSKKKADWLVELDNRPCCVEISAVGDTEKFTGTSAFTQVRTLSIDFRSCEVHISSEAVEDFRRVMGKVFDEWQCHFQQMKEGSTPVTVILPAWTTSRPVENLMFGHIGGVLDPEMRAWWQTYPVISAAFIYRADYGNISVEMYPLFNPCAAVPLTEQEKKAVQGFRLVL
jgi:hypothetical protein